MEVSDGTKDKLTNIGGFIATFVSLWYPAAALSGNVFSLISSNVNARRLKRIESLLHRLEERLDAEAARQVKPDLFEEIIGRAAQDEDAEKVNHYAALIEISPTLQPYEIRALATLIQSLTVLEILALQAIHRGEKSRVELPPLLADSFWPRIEGFGLSAGTVKYKGNLTSLGIMLMKIAERAATEPIERGG